MWDCACGTGQATLSLAQRFTRVTATDASAQQIAAATPVANVTYRVAPAESSGLAAASCDLVTVAQALHWFDATAFYSEAQRVLVKGGVIAIWSYGVMEPDDPRLDELMRELHYETVGEYWPPERALVEAGYAGIDFPFKEIAISPQTMAVQWTLAQLLGYFRSWSATTRYIAARGSDPVTPLGERMARIWGNPAATRRIAWPLSLRCGRRCLTD